MSGSTVATLGPSGTSSEFVVARQIGRFPSPVSLVLWPSYEDAAAAVARGDADFLVVAAAFPRLHTLLFEPPQALEVVDCFVAATPELVIAVRRDDTAPPRTIASAPAPVPFVHAAFPQARVVAAASNAAAAQMVIAAAADAAFTTGPAAAAAGLLPLRSFGDVPMAWVVVARRNGPYAWPRSRRQ